MDPADRRRIIDEHQTHSGDSGSSEVQIALLTARIASLTDHFRQHAHDHAGRRGLLQLVGRRRRLLSYLSRESVSRYRELVSRLGLRR